MIREEDLAADGEPEKEFNPGIAGRLPRKTIAGGALIRDEGGRILFLEAVYKPTLEIPGGVAEFDESPLEACRREVLEEIGLDLEIRDALVVDWIPARDPWFDGVMFIFDGGVMSSEQADRIVLDASEAQFAGRWGRPVGTLQVERFVELAHQMPGRSRHAGTLSTRRRLVLGVCASVRTGSSCRPGNLSAARRRGRRSVGGLLHVLSVIRERARRRAHADHAGWRSPVATAVIGCTLAQLGRTRAIASKVGR
ncbi:NUDIX domain-containing protein [Kribbella albertanoniae]|uniref:NUDIX hydrolase n=1 Tax=Kribbella albertanoniae TaxID=1266829 RepID=A0A4V2XMR0_9ACTN|nr:NUDIX hydrolase [Kribbella albertanoniae]